MKRSCISPTVFFPLFQIFPLLLPLLLTAEYFRYRFDSVITGISVTIIITLLYLRYRFRYRYTTKRNTNFNKRMVYTAGMHRLKKQRHISSLQMFSLYSSLVFQKRVTGRAPVIAKVSWLEVEMAIWGLPEV